MILNNDARIDEWHRAVRTGAAGNVNDAIDAFGRWQRAVGGRMSGASARLLLAFLESPSAKGSRLTLRFTAKLGQLLSEAGNFGFELGDPLMQGCDFPVACLATETNRNGKSHAAPNAIGIGG